MSGWISEKTEDFLFVHRQPFLWSVVAIPFPNGVIHRLRHG